MQSLKKPVKQSKKPQQTAKNVPNNAKVAEKLKERAFNNSVPPTKPVSQQSLEKTAKISEKIEETAHFPQQKLGKAMTLEEKSNSLAVEPQISLKKPNFHENSFENREKAAKSEKIERKAEIFREGMPKARVLQVLTGKILVLTEELEKLSRIVAQSMEENRVWKAKYSKLKELYLKNVEEDVNADFFLEESGYKLEETRENSDFQEKARKFETEFAETSESLRKTQQEIGELQQKAENFARKQREKAEKAGETQIDCENRIKVLQNELEILRTEQNNRNKTFSEEKYEKLLKNFLALKEEKDLSEKKFQVKLQEFDPSSSVLLSIPNEEAGNAREKAQFFEEIARNKEKITKEAKKSGKDKTISAKKTKK